MDSEQNIYTQLYHQHHSENVEDIKFWMKLAEQSGGAVLELGCGTGRVTSHLAQLGQRIVGFDNDFLMLSVLQEKLPIQSRRMVDIFQADMGSYHLDREFSLIFLACNTFSTLEPATRKRVVILSHRHLHEEGVFAASIPNPIRLKNLPEIGDSEVETDISHPITNNPLQISSEWGKVDQFVVFRWHYDHLKPNGNVERTTIENRHIIIDPAVYKAEFREAGFNNVTTYGDFDKSIFNQNSPYLILVGKKGRKF